MRNTALRPTVNHNHTAVYIKLQMIKSIKSIDELAELFGYCSFHGILAIGLEIFEQIVVET